VLGRGGVDMVVKRSELKRTIIRLLELKKGKSTEEIY
jgi:acetyl-CoA carboxylase beta subunit